MAYVRIMPVELTEEEVRLLEKEHAEKAERARLEAEILSAEWGEKTCVQCGQRLIVWADIQFKRCGYCRHPLAI